MTLIPNVDAANPPYGVDKGHLVSMASFTRNADVLLYTTGDVVGDQTGEPRAIVFPTCGPSGEILRAQLIIEENDAQTLELYVFDEEPTNFADNEALALVAADMPKLVGVFDFASGDAKVVATASSGILVYTLAAGVLRTNTFTAQDGSNLYGLLVVRSAWTPTSAAKIHLRLEIKHD